MLSLDEKMEEKAEEERRGLPRELVKDLKLFREGSIEQRHHQLVKMGKSNAGDRSEIREQHSLVTPI
jgi:hypothetical protein